MDPKKRLLFALTKKTALLGEKLNTIHSHQVMENITKMVHVTAWNEEKHSFYKHILFASL
jgi:hypothetical protein